MLRPRIARIHGNGSIAQHCLRTRGGDGDVGNLLAIYFCRLGQRISQVPKMPSYIVVFDFIVGEDRLRGGVPVYQALAAINQPVGEELEERLPHGPGAHVVHGEPRAVPVAAAAHQLELVDYADLVLILPRLHSAYEFLAGEVRATLVFLGEDAFLDDRLRGDARVVRARHP